MSKYTPATKQELKALVKLCKSKEFAEHSARVEASAEFKAAVAVVRAKHAALFADPVVKAEHKKGLYCAWEKFGLKAACSEIAEQFGIPHWTILGHANSSM
jgi:hypothetical protein